MKKNLHPLTPAALYARVSSDRQDIDLSVSAQLRALKDYAKANGYSVAREYVDEVESGRVADRPQFREMIEESSQPKAPFEVILMDWTQSTRKTAVLVGGRFGYNQVRSGGTTNGCATSTLMTGSSLLRWARVYCTANFPLGCINLVVQRFCIDG